MKIDEDEKPDANINKQKDEITELRNELNDLRKQMLRTEKLSTLGMLSAGIAHEIKNPLNFIKNFAELSVEYLQEIEELADRIKQGEIAEEIHELIKDVKGNLSKIQHHEGRISSIVSSMLLHARGGSGKFEPSDINQIIKEFVNLAFHGMRAGKDPINVEIQQNLDESLPMVPLKAEDFSRVVLNLCNNAFDALRENLKKINSNPTEASPQKSAVLRVSSGRIGDWVEIVIEDNGPGIPKSNIEKIFEPFFTTKKSSQGTGLGLSITKDIIDNHGGNLKIDSVEGAYTKFIIEIPIHINEIKNENLDS
jgi:signal transduction histidine kinase